MGFLSMPDPEFMHWIIGNNTKLLSFIQTKQYIDVMFDSIESAFGVY